MRCSSFRSSAELRMDLSRSHRCYRPISCVSTVSSFCMTISPVMWLLTFFPFPYSDRRSGCRHSKPISKSVVVLHRLPIKMEAGRNECAQEQLAHVSEGRRSSEREKETVSTRSSSSMLSHIFSSVHRHTSVPPPSTVKTSYHNELANSRGVVTLRVLRKCCGMMWDCSASSWRLTSCLHPWCSHQTSR